MTILQFADTHNLVAFLAKPVEIEGFKQIVDFLNAYTIKYALTVNLMIYTACIKQLWATIKAKTVNEEVQLQALVDGKKIIVTEASVRRDLQLNDEEGTNCLPNATIFEELTRISAKTTAWNEFSSTMDSAIICLATNQKFNFSKYIFESMVKNLDNASKFLMYPRVGKGFSGRETPLFPTMVVQNQAEMGEDSAILTDPHHTPTIIQPSTSQPQNKQRSRRPKRKDTEVGGSARIVSSNEANLGDQEDASKQGRKINDIDKDAEITLVDKTQGSVDEVTLAQALAALKSAKVQEKANVVEEPSESITTTSTLTATIATTVTAASTRPKAKGLVIHEEEQATTPTVSSQQPSQVKAQDKGKGIMVEEPVKMKKKDQISLDEELAFKLQAKEEEEERLAREKFQRE
ncbi:hypothetical protein Tco_0012604 [Tanacetum coccineum]